MYEEQYEIFEKRYYPLNTTCLLNHLFDVAKSEQFDKLALIKSFWLKFIYTNIMQLDRPQTI